MKKSPSCRNYSNLCGLLRKTQLYIKGLLNEKVLFLFLHKHVYCIFRCFILCHFWTMNLSAWFLPKEQWKSHLKLIFRALLSPGSTGPEIQFEMRLPLFLWMKSSGQIHSSKMARNKAMKKVIILIFLFLLAMTLMKMKKYKERDLC